MKIIAGRRARLLGFLSVICALGVEVKGDGALDIAIINGNKELKLPLVSGIDRFEVLRSPSIGVPFAPSTSGVISGYSWREAVTAGPNRSEFFSVRMLPKPANEVLAATVLNRLAYGPTPDELERVQQIGPDAYIQEQLAPEKISESLDIDQVNTSTDWQHVVVTGTGSSSTLYIYMSAKGDCYIDDIQIVRGNVPETGANLVKNGDFENGLTSWTVSPIVAASAAVTDVKHGGTSALHLVSSGSGDSQGTSIYQANLGLSARETYTLSYWYKPGTSRSSSPVLRLSGSGILSSPGSLATRLAFNVASLNDLTAWHVLHAVQSKKQLLETLLQFMENHFVTQQSKSRDYLDRFYDDAQTDQMATSLEYQEINRWRQALLNPQCTFHDLLKISAESPAMIIYLDTINSKGNGSNIANENYARELLELFTFGVDNGYDQNDITVMSRVWTGWSMKLVDPENVNNPFALQTTNVRPGSTNIPPRISDLDGVWSFAYKSENHANGEKIIFPGKVVPDRFGPPYAGRNYELKLSPAGENSSWQYVTKTGRATATSPLYFYMEGTGDCYIDDVTLVAGAVPEGGNNLIVNPGFESPLAGSGWSGADLPDSKIVSDVTHSGSGALHIISKATRDTGGIRKTLTLTTNQIYTLSFWYKPGANMTGPLIARLSGSRAENDGIYVSPAATNTIQEGYTVVKHLADQPFTQEFLSVKLCRLLVHDDFAHGYDFTDPNLSPEGKLVRECMRAWEENVPKGQIRKVLEVIFNSELFRSQAAASQKVKTPFEFTVSAARALRSFAADSTWTENVDAEAIRTAMNRMGRMRLFDRDNPDGYPEAAAPWISAGTLTERLRYVQTLLGRANNATSPTDPLKLLKAKLPQAAWKDADAVSSYFVGILFPGEGKANVDEYRLQARTYLNTADDGVTNSPFASVSETGNPSPYELRVRGMVAMLMTFQRFQEQ